ncbi:HEPN domain-containing protein [Chloroflexus islandicus]|uniref:HEPN domain-containing protein n=1 Tax=Chloroflexus islandicus TaxID=1707952 RepID=UPI000AC5E5FF
MKALLVRYQIPFPKTHDIGYLLKLAAQADAALPQELADAELLTPFGVDFRYPGAEIVDRAMVAQAVAWATMVKDAVLNRLQSYLAAGRPQ